MPSLVVNGTTTSQVAALSSATSNDSVAPSVTVMSDTRTCGASTLVMVPTPMASASEAFTGELNTNCIVSEPSLTPSAEVATVTVLDTSPGENTSVPDTAE